MRVADAVWQRIKKETSVVYFVAGGGAMYLVDALGRSGIQCVAHIHEQGAGFAAIGHAMYTNRLAVCLVTSGPGSTNVLSAVAAAWTDSLPVLFISGQAKTSTLVGDSGLRTKGVQEVDIIRMVKPITKEAYQPMSSGLDCLMALDDMILECMHQRRGPCFLSIPLDVQNLPDIQGVNS